jgi:hypothetical protein
VALALLFMREPGSCSLVIAECQYSCASAQNEQRGEVQHAGPRDVPGHLCSQGLLRMKLFTPGLLAQRTIAPVWPNVRVKRETPVWRLAREVHDEQGRIAGQVPRRWLSA